MLARQPQAPLLAHALPHRLDVLVGVLLTDLEVDVGAVSGERVELPPGGEKGGRDARGRLRRVVGEAGVVGLEEGPESRVVGGRRRGGDGDVLEEIDEVCAAGAVEVEQEGWVGRRVGQGGEADQRLIPWRVSRVGGVFWSEEVGGGGVGWWAGSRRRRRVRRRRRRRGRRQREARAANMRRVRRGGCRRDCVLLPKGGWEGDVHLL